MSQDKKKRPPQISFNARVQLEGIELNVELLKRLKQQQLNKTNMQHNAGTNECQ
jgi:hypothetical protein